MNNHNKFLIVGLGNPGTEYSSTRHNAGFWALDEIRGNLNATAKLEKKFYGHVAKANVNNCDTFLFTPNTYMNVSGKAVAAITNYYTIAAAEILVIHDDLDLPIGTAKLKDGGGHQGHNGLRDIIAVLGTNNFKRLRIGIGHPGDRDAVHDYVLSSPSKADKQEILAAIARAAAVIPEIIANHWQLAVNKLHSGEKFV